ncbi:vacuolar protein sorting-associated protein 60.1-like isoform X2 [Primulina tabacum]|uniref:vacuolar protein sorting-associated protein 60.1-like isoform X2 n=1 Tax=Primulina tabacum TaxID=48773 RepID=UPI003F59C166
MMRVFGAKKDKEPQPSLQEFSDRINKRGDSIDEKIKKLDAELARYKDQIKKTRPGPAQEAIKARATRVLKQKRIYEGQRDMLYNRTFNLDQVAFAADGIKDAQQTNLQDEMLDLMDVSNEIQEPMMYLMRSMRMNSCVAVDELGLFSVP